MPITSYVFPATGQGFARDACLTAVSSSGSGLPFLGTGTYEVGGIYISDGNIVLPLSGSVPFPILFGSWVYVLLGGQLPTQQTNGGLDFIGGGYGGIAWTNLAYTGNEALQLQASFGGALAFDSSLPTLAYTVTGMEVFSVQYQVLDVLPQQLEVQFYESTLGWHKVWLGDSDHFGLGGTDKGTVPPVLNQWVNFTFTPSDLGVTPGMIITGMAWGVWQGGGTSTVIFSDATNQNSGSIPITTVPGGFIDASPDGNTGFYILAHEGPLVDVPSIGGEPTLINLATSPSFAYTGLTYNSVHSVPYFIGYDGTIYNYSGGTVNTITSIPSGAIAPARQLFNDGANLYTAFPKSNKIGKYNISGNSWVLTASPFSSFLDTIYYSADIGKVVAGGRNNTIDLHNSNIIEDMTYASVPNQLLVTDSSNTISIYNFTNGNWSFSQSLAGTGNPTAIAATPLGTQALVVDTTNNLLQILTYLGGTWAATPAPLAIAGPTAIVSHSSGLVQAFVCQTADNTLAILNQDETSNWEVIQTLFVPGPTSVAVANAIGIEIPTAMVSNSNGVSFLTFNGAVWQLSAGINLAVVPTQTAVDAVNLNNDYFYAAAQNGGNIIVYVFQNQALLGQYTFAGTLGSLNVINYQSIVPTVSGAINAGYYVGGMTNNQVISATAPISGQSSLWVPEQIDYPPLLLIAGSNDIWSYINDKPQSLSRVLDASVATLSGVSWTSVDLNDHNMVSSITTDPSGNIFTVNTQNAIYKIVSQTTIASGYPYTIIPPTNQESGIPLGLSKLLWWEGALWSSMSLTGGLVKIIP